MMNVSGLAKLSGLSVRTLRYYDEIGLLRPSRVTEAGYRQYGQEAVERLGQIMFFRELEFSLKDIRGILESPGFDRQAALVQQLTLLRLRRDRLNHLIELTEGAINMGTNSVDFKAFDTSEIEAYKQEAKKRWGGSPAWTEYEEKWAALPQAGRAAANQGLMEVFKGFGRLLAAGEKPEAQAAAAQAQKLQAYITAHYYACTPEILAQLGQMYTGDSRFRENIDAYAGPGTAQFAAAAIAAYCKNP